MGPFGSIGLVENVQRYVNKRSGILKTPFFGETTISICYADHNNRFKHCVRVG